MLLFITWVARHGRVGTSPKPIQAQAAIYLTRSPRRVQGRAGSPTSASLVRRESVRLLIFSSTLASLEGTPSIRNALGTRFWTSNRRVNWKVASYFVKMSELAQHADIREHDYAIQN